jgi:hypothetical protein
VLLEDEKAVIYGAGGSTNGAVSNTLIGEGSKVFRGRCAREAPKRAPDNTSGSTNLAFDDQCFSAIGSEVNLQSPNHDGVPERWDIAITGGVSNVVLDTCITTEVDTTADTTERATCRNTEQQPARKSA